MWLNLFRASSILHCMRVFHTKHAEEKFDILKKYGVSISRQQVEAILRSPDHIDRSRYPLLTAQGTLDSIHVLRIVYRRESNVIIVITFYPGRISHYVKA